MEVTQLSQLGLTKSDLVVVFDYLFRKISIKEFKKHFPNSLEVKRRIDRCGYILLNCKLFAYAHHVAVSKGLKKPNPRKYEVDPNDARFLRRLDLTHIPKKYICHTLEGFQASMAEFLNSKEFGTLLGKFISKKMRFMIQSYGDTREDLDMSMRVAAMYNIYRVYPYFESYLHMCNVGKGAATKAGHSLIKSRTTQKNQRLLTNADGTNSAKLVPLGSVHHKLQQEEEIDLSVEIIEAIANRCAPRVQRFFYLMQGNHDPEFSEFLGQDNKEAALEMRYDVYQANVQKFMEITPSQVQRLYKRLRDKYTEGGRIYVK